MSEQPDPMEPDDDFQAAELVLGLAQGDDLTRVRRRALTDGLFAERVAQWQERFVAMTDSIAPVKPRRRVKKQLMATVFATPHKGLFDHLWIWKGLTLASLVLAAYYALPTLRPVTTPPELYATQLKGETGDLEILAVFDPVQNDIALRRVSGAAPAGRALELWALLPEQSPVSLGVLPNDTTTRVLLPEALREQLASLTLAISDEPPGGAPDGAPTGSILAVGAVEEF